MFSILQKPQESVNAEDLEILQNEIEQRLAESVIQKWELQRELLESGDALNCKSPDSNNHLVLSADGAPRALLNGPTHSIENASDGFKGELFASNISKSHRSKIVPSKFRNSCEESPRPSKDQVFRNEAPDKLWPFVEQFCATPTEEQIKELQEMIEEMDSKDNKEYYKLPNVVASKETSIKDSTTKNDSGKSQRESKAAKSGEEGSWGALTLRLVSSFFDDSDDINADLSKSPSCPSSPARKKRKTKHSKNEEVNEAKNLEKKIRQQLEEYSILSRQDNIPYTSEDDEDLRLLVGYQNELRSIREQNKYLMEKLLIRARKHFELDKERKKLNEANADVIAAYHRLIQAKQRKRNPTKKEKDAAWRALKIYEPIFKNCDDLYMSSLEYSGL